MKSRDALTTQTGQVDMAVLHDLIRRAAELDNAYRAIAEQAGQFYMKADESGLSALTDLLDKPMRNASANQQTFAALLGQLQMQANQRARPGTAGTDARRL